MRHRKPSFHCMLIFLFLALTSCGTDQTGTDQQNTQGDIPFEGCIQGDFHPFWGVLHAHTSYSDGELTPADAFAYGRDEGGLDILVITDHLEQIYLPFPVDQKWQRCRDHADAAYDPGAFLSDCGFEYGSGFTLPCFQSTGHNNVFFSDSLFPMIQLDFHDFYQSLVDCPTCIGQFNHPGDPTDLNWNGFEYFHDVDQRMNLFEFNSDPAWDLFFEALDAGWHVSPMYNQDNHSADWGTRNGRRSGFYLSDLAREDLRDAMLDRRSFMSYDKNASIKVTAMEACWMGSILSGSLPQFITLEVEAFDRDTGDGFTTIEIYGPGKEILDTADCQGSEDCNAVFSFNVLDRTYFVARASQDDGDWLVSAPIWIERTGEDAADGFD